MNHLNFSSVSFHCGDSVFDYAVGDRSFGSVDVGDFEVVVGRNCFDAVGSFETFNNGFYFLLSSNEVVLRWSRTHADVVNEALFGWDSELFFILSVAFADFAFGYFELVVRESVVIQTSYGDACSASVVVVICLSIEFVGCEGSKLTLIFHYFELFANHFFHFVPSCFNNFGLGVVGVSELIEFFSCLEAVLLSTLSNHGDCSFAEEERLHFVFSNCDSELFNSVVEKSFVDQLFESFLLDLLEVDVVHAHTALFVVFLKVVSALNEFVILQFGAVDFRNSVVVAEDVEACDNTSDDEEQDGKTNYKDHDCRMFSDFL